MALTIQDLFIDPPLAIARLGGSSVPQDAYVWVPAPEPRAGDTTTIAPTWSLAVQQDATVEPMLPTEVTLRDGPLIRPVCPFFEVWARIGQPGSRPKTWVDVPVTPALLAAAGASLADLTIAADARNLKAARRTGLEELKFGTFPPVSIAGDAHVPVPLEGVSPGNTRVPMIPPGKNIPLGVVQVLRSRPQPGNSTPWARAVNVEVIRFRYTPARGLVYGVPDAAKRHRTARRNHFAPVDRERAFLNPLAGWFGATVLGLDAPDDTYDGADVHPQQNPALGVVDDTCEVRFDVSLRLRTRRSVLTASARAFVGPPDFAPDRRPFLSLADEINDRGAHSHARSRSMSKDEKDDWVQDLFERIFETASLFNVDMQRQGRGALLKGRQRRAAKIKGDEYPEPLRAMGGRDRLRNEHALPLQKRTKEEPLPLTERAVGRHRELADVMRLREFILQKENRNRLRQIVRPPFEVEPGETTLRTSMRMPPFMRNSNALPLTLAPWQYELLMKWVDHVPGRGKARARRAAEAEERRQQVLKRVRRNGRPL